MSDFGFMGKTISVFAPNTEIEETENFGEVCQEKPETKFEKEIKDKLNIIILNLRNENFDEAEVGNVVICGKKMIDYVVNSCIVKPQVLSCGFVHDVLSEIKPYLIDKELTLVLYADTPLLKKSTLLEILEYVYYNGINVCKFTRGYCFKTEYIKRVSEIYSAQNYTFEEEDFDAVVSFETLIRVRQSMKDRICSFHLKNGVDIISPETCYIDSCVNIEKGCVIHPNVQLLGVTEISKDCEVGFGSIIKNSKIEEDCKIFNSVIKESVLGEHTVVKDGCLINQSKLDEKCKIYEKVCILNSSVGERVKFESASHVSSATIDDDCVIGEGTIIAKNEGFRTKILKNVYLNAGVKICGGVTIAENMKVPAFEFVNKNINTKE